MAKLRVATTSLAGCFGCHMSLLDIDERFLQLVELVEFNRSPLTDIKHCDPCDIGLIEGGVCNAENVHVLREFRKNCKVLVALGACAVNGGLPAQRNHLDLHTILEEVYHTAPWPRCRQPDPRRSRAAAVVEQSASHPRSGEDRLLPARLPTLRRRDLEIPHRPDCRPHAASRP